MRNLVPEPGKPSSSPSLSLTLNGQHCRPRALSHPMPHPAPQQGLHTDPGLNQPYLKASTHGKQGTLSPRAWSSQRQDPCFLRRVCRG